MRINIKSSSRELLVSSCPRLAEKFVLEEGTGGESAVNGVGKWPMEVPGRWREDDILITEEPLAVSECGSMMVEELNEDLSWISLVESVTDSGFVSLDAEPLRASPGANGSELTGDLSRTCVYRTKIIRNCPGTHHGPIWRA